MTAGAVSLRKSHDIVILSFCNICSDHLLFYVLMTSLDHKKVRLSHLFQMCSKSVSNDMITFSPFCSNENMRFSYILVKVPETSS